MLILKVYHYKYFLTRGRRGNPEHRPDSVIDEPQPIF